MKSAVWRDIVGFGDERWSIEAGWEPVFIGHVVVHQRLRCAFVEYGPALRQIGI